MSIKQYTTCLFLFMCMLPGILYGQIAQRFDYGVRGTLNLNTIGTRIGKYNGGGYYSLGTFASYKALPYCAVAFEPTYSVSGFREKQKDNRYVYQHIDLNMNAYLSPFNDEALRIYLGLRPAYLLNFKAETLTNGSYVKTEATENKNKSGQWDFGLNAGVSVQLSQVVTIELGYMWSATDQTNNQQIKGRNNLLELGLKINAVDLKRILDTKEQTVKQQVQNYRKGSLLVMLPTLSAKELARFKNEADRNFAVNELRIRNLKVINEFIKHYTFTPVYFFLDTNANRVSMGNLDGIFVDHSMTPAPTLKPTDTTNYFVASFCNDISNYNQRVSFGLFVYDAKMNQLSKPFNVPSQMFGLYTDGDPANYFRTRRQNYVNMPFDRMIRKFNSRMIRYAEFDN